MIGTALFGSGSGGPGGSGSATRVMPALVHSAQTATIVNLVLIVAALACAFGLPRRLADQQDDNRQGGQGTGGAEDTNGESSGEPPDQRTAATWPERGGPLPVPGPARGPVSRHRETFLTGVPGRTR